MWAVQNWRNYFLIRQPANLVINQHSLNIRRRVAAICLRFTGALPWLAGRGRLEKNTIHSFLFFLIPLYIQPLSLMLCGCPHHQFVNVIEKKNTKFAYKRTSYKAENAIGWGMRSKLSQNEDFTIKGRQVSCTIKEASISEYESASQWPIPLPPGPPSYHLHCFPRKRGSSLFSHTLG